MIKTPEKICLSGRKKTSTQLMRKKENHTAIIQFLARNSVTYNQN